MCAFNPVFKLPEQLLMVASVEAPFALLEEPVEAFLFDAIEPTQMTLGLIPEVFNAVNVIAPVGEELGVVDAHVAEVANVESIVGLERIVIDDTVGLHFPSMIGRMVAVLASGMTAVKTFPPLLGSPKTATLPAAPRPRLPLRLPPK